MKITILSENYLPVTMGLKAEHGFSAFIDTGSHSFLYDTGQSGICTDNARALKCDLSKASHILLSHGHIDHTGGLAEALKACGPDAVVAGHKGIFENKFVMRADAARPGASQAVFIGLPFARAFLERHLQARFELRNAVSEILPGAWLTGEVPAANDFEQIPTVFQVERGGRLVQDDFADDNSLVLESRGGLVVVLGCAHRGIVNILSYVKARFKQPVCAVIGGTHLHDASPVRNERTFAFLREFFAREQTRLFAPAHCTGFAIIASFAREFGSMVQPAFCGSSFEFA